MYSIKGTTIKLTKGDTFIANVELYRDNEIYVPQEGDAIRFAMRKGYVSYSGKSYESDDVILTKDVDISTRILRLESEDTKNLAYGKYIYDMQITFADGTVDTFIAGATLILTIEVD